MAEEETVAGTELGELPQEEATVSGARAAPNFTIMTYLTFQYTNS